MIRFIQCQIDSFQALSFLSAINSFCSNKNKAMLPAWAMKAHCHCFLVATIMLMLMPARTYTNLPTTPLPASRRHGVGVPKSKQRCLGGFLRLPLIFSLAACNRLSALVYFYLLHYSHTVHPSFSFYSNFASPANIYFCKSTIDNNTTPGPWSRYCHYYRVTQS